MRKDLLNVLNYNKCIKVKFKTKSGTIREMECTRDLEAIPKFQHEGINNPKLNGPLICCVYDWTNTDFRAFRWDSVLDWEIVTE